MPTPFRTLLVLAALIRASALPAQAPGGTDAVPVVDRIELTRRNIFADSEATFFLPRLVNYFHVTTQRHVIERELLFDVGRPLRPDALQETARNLRRLGVFRIVRVDTLRRDSALVVRVQTQDGWSTKPEVAFRSTGGQTAWRASLIEENLGGTASRLVLGYIKEPDRSTLYGAFRQPRLFANTIGIGAAYEDRSDGEIVTAYLLRPFLSFHDRFAWQVSVDSRDERVLRYFEGHTAQAGDTLFRNFNAVGASYGWAAKAEGRIFHRLGVNARIWKDDFTAPGVARQDRAASGAVGFGYEFRRSRYAVVRGFTASRDEDVDLSTSVRAGIALTPKRFGHDDDGVVAGVGIRTGGILTPNTFAYVDLMANGRFTSAGLDSGTVMTGATLFHEPAKQHSAIAHLGAGWLRNPRPGGEFDLGLGLGPRGYKLHGFTGDRAVQATVEYRYMAVLDLLRVIDFGVAGFADWGGAWYSGSKRRTGWDTGFGLRLGPSRSTDIELTRIDLVYRGKNDVEPGGWLVVIGRGLVFSTSSVLTR